MTPSPRDKRHGDHTLRAFVAEFDCRRCSALRCWTPMPADDHDQFKAHARLRQLFARHNAKDFFKQ